MVTRNSFYTLKILLNLMAAAYNGKMIGTNAYK